MTLEECLGQMSEKYRADPVAAVRSQGFIKLLHAYLAVEMRARLSKRRPSSGRTNRKTLMWQSLTLRMDPYCSLDYGAK
jgi:hypothetical protein